jgi:putative membrane protein
MVTWMAMLYYLPRLFVYHVEHNDNKKFVEVVKIQEYKLYKYIGLPAFWATFISGSSMIIISPELFSSGVWLYAKLTVVAFLIAYSFSLNHFRRILAKDECTKNGKFFRFYNEVPTLLSIMIIVFVIIKPF